VATYDRHSKTQTRGDLRPPLKNPNPWRPAPAT